MISPRRSLPSPTICLAMAAVALVIGILLGIFAMGDRVLPGDVDIATMLQRPAGVVPETLARIGNTAGSTGRVAPIIVIALLISAALRSWADVAFLLTLLMLRIAAIPLKATFTSPRPTADVLTIHGVFDGYGFPSGHSLTAATLCLGLAVLAWRHIPSRMLAIAAVLALTASMLLVGWARVWVGAHWPSDVAGGFAFGVVVVALGMTALTLTERLRHGVSTTVGM